MPPEQQTTPATAPADTTPVSADALQAEIMAAVSAGLAEQAAPAPAAPAEAAPPATPVATDPPAAPAADGAPPPADPAAPPAAPAATDPPKPADGATPPAAAPPADAPKKPSDEFGELPQDAKAETKERFGKLKGALDTEVEKRTQAEAVARQWTETIASTKATPEQFGGVLNYLSEVNKGTPEALENAYEMMKSEFTALSKMLGKPLPGLVDPLADHPDLKARIDAEQLDTEGALEIVRSRAREKLTTASQKVSRETEAASEAQQTALASIRSFGEQQRAANPALYAAKMQIMEPMVKRVIARLPPAEWAGEIQALYASINVQAPTPTPTPTSTPTPAANNAPDSIRPAGSLGAGGELAKEPATPLEAVQLAMRTFKS